ncbi:hypothetical protein CANARDRAFT_27717 [[Candida] arabinofermentans NRRL YB-2248]|uniref:Tyrosine--tRNA ligase n=1 Tax=[Candida] arabinofermentans NRRL YB-2248 TaxID=983967 RepID=A0A1E4T441_9ASCO|nr:hypothetical protein CANARDRAFT_27717 [[Candida] arabinofermentans NRRL YB-2248]
MIGSGRFLITNGSRFFSTSCSVLKNSNAFQISGSISKLLHKYNIDVLESDFQKDIKQPLLENLRHRGLIETCVNEEELSKKIESSKLGLYCGADPTAKSLHLGNLLPLMILLHFNLRNHNIVALVGGATGAVGDPSGRTTERDHMEENIRDNNVKRIGEQMLNFFKNGLIYAESRNPNYDLNKFGNQQFVNNFDWWKRIGMLEFLSKYGKFIRINQMLARDSIKSRLSSDKGLGFNEFSYQILQAYDFYHLNKHLDVDVQVGGNDQYGNIVAGIDLINRLNKKKSSYGITVPLLTTSNGVKFGKSAGNAIFIDKELSAPFIIYQFMFNTSDEDVKKFMYKFSLLPISVIDKILDKHNLDKKMRIGQRFLAWEMCDLIHGDGEGYSCNILSELLYNKESDFSTNEILNAFRTQNMLHTMSLRELDSSTIGDVLSKCLIDLHSRSDIKKLIKSGAVSYNIGGGKVIKFKSFTDELNPSVHLRDNKLLLVKIGKSYHAIEVV